MTKAPPVPKVAHLWLGYRGGVVQFGCSQVQLVFIVEIYTTGLVWFGSFLTSSLNGILLAGNV